MLEKGDMQSSSTLVIKLPRRFGAKEARSLQHELKHQLSDETSVVFDLSQVRQMDIAGIEAMRKCMAQIARRDGSIQLGEISPEAQIMLELTRMNHVFAMFPRFSVDSESFAVSRIHESEEDESGAILRNAADPQALVA
ncbi:MAG: anti-sigma-factor antagonist [Acidobacteriaceae bacterium]|nr:anti-sigma-factor antagonist [Acidobacteriaceae bacterium]